jgi:hypothetical protein
MISIRRFQNLGRVVLLGLALGALSPSAWAETKATPEAAPVAAPVVAPAPKGPESYTITLTAQEINVIWTSLQEMPAKHALPVMTTLKKQFDDQNAEFTSRKTGKPEGADEKK